MVILAAKSTDARFEEVKQGINCVVRVRSALSLVVLNAYLIVALLIVNSSGRL